MSTKDNGFRAIETRLFYYKLNFMENTGKALLLLTFLHLLVKIIDKSNVCNFNLSTGWRVFRWIIM